jgi:hypothetical protein
MAQTTIEVEVDAADLKDRKADERGRINLGTDFADAQVRVAVVEVLDDGENGE